MKTLMLASVLLFSKFVLASCPNLTGTYVGERFKDVIKIDQKSCQLLETYSASRLSAPLMHVTNIVDGLIHQDQLGYYRKSFWKGTTLVVQAYYDFAGQRPAGPQSGYSLMYNSASVVIGLNVVRYFGSSNPDTLVYKKMK